MSDNQKTWFGEYARRIALIRKELTLSQRQIENSSSRTVQGFDRGTEQNETPNHRPVAIAAVPATHLAASANVGSTRPSSSLRARTNQEQRATSQRSSYDSRNRADITNSASGFALGNNRPIRKSSIARAKTLNSSNEGYEDTKRNAVPTMDLKPPCYFTRGEDIRDSVELYKSRIEGKASRERRALAPEPKFQTAEGQGIKKISSRGRESTSSRSPTAVAASQFVRALSTEYQSVQSGSSSSHSYVLKNEDHTGRSTPLSGSCKETTQKPVSHSRTDNDAERSVALSQRAQAVSTTSHPLRAFESHPLRAFEKQVQDRKPQREKLPICSHQETIVEYIASHRVTCIRGETGCGKSSMVPQFVLEHFEQNSPSYVRYLPPKAAKEYQANIVVTQPRRLAAKTLARRVASDLGEEIGETVGYAIARDSKRSHDTRITYVTTGYLLQLFVSNPQSFQRYTHVILDEIHERQIDSDLLSLVIKLSMTQHNKTKIVVMSATLQGKLFTKYFSEAVDTSWGARAAFIPDPIFVGASRFNVNEFYLEQFLNMSQLQPSLSAQQIKSIAKAWISFSASSPRDITQDISQVIRSLNHRDLLHDQEVSQQGINRSVNRQRKKGIPFPNIQDGLLEVGEKLIMTFAKPGETTLVFLPGMADIQEMYEKLEPYEMNPKNIKIHLFTLHSRIPNDEQEAAFKDPPQDTAHVILATNIAESSLTLPKVRIVIDYGLRKQCVYHPGRQMSSIQDTWISQASATQRTGRTGRVFEGFVFRMYTNFFYDRVFEEFDAPEMEKSPLDKLVLRIKWMGRNIAPGESVRELLSQAVQPPSLEQLEAAIERLADVGALSDYSEEADITLIGHAALRLPLNLMQCRLVVYGIIMGCPCDAVVMAASMTLRQEPFKLPLRMIIKDPWKYLHSLKRSFTSRVKFDEGLYSGPITMRNLFAAWLEEVKRSGSHDTGLTHNAERASSGQDHDPMTKTAARLNSLRKQFCWDNSLDCKRFKEFENSVAEVASRMVGFLSDDSDGHKKITDLMRILCTEEEDDVVLNFGDDDITGEAAASCLTLDVKSTRPTKAAQTKWFCEDSDIVKALLVASLSPTVIVGTCFDEVKQSGLQIVNKCERTATAMEKNGFDPKKSVALNNILDGNLELKGNTKIVKEIVSIACEPCRVDFAGTYDRVFLEFSYDHRMPQDKSLLHDVPFKAHLLNQFGEGRNRFAVPLSQDTFAYRICRRDQLEFQQPIQPYRLHWSYGRQKRKEKQPHVMQAFFSNWRNPIGYACDGRGKEVKHFAVAAEIKGDDKKCHVSGVTILPSENDGILAKLMLLAFISQNYKVEFTLSPQSPATITEVNLSGVSLSFGHRCPLNVTTLSKINEVRMAISEIFKNCAGGRLKIPDCKVKTLLTELFNSCRVQATSTRTHAYAATYGTHPTVKVSPFANVSSGKTKDDSFTILEPFDLGVFSAQRTPQPQVRSDQWAQQPSYRQRGQPRRDSTSAATRLSYFEKLMCEDLYSY